MAANIPVLVRLSGRCANGAERDGGRRIHLLLVDTPLAGNWWGRAVCGAKPGRLSGCGFVEVDGPENPTCPRCRRILERQAKKGERS